MNESLGNSKPRNPIGVRSFRTPRIFRALGKHLLGVDKCLASDQ